MPESKKTTKAAYTPPPSKKAPPKPNPGWFLPTLITLMLLGLIWIVVFYISNQKYPIPDIGAWNLACGFALIMIGFGMTTRWR